MRVRDKRQSRKFWQVFVPGRTMCKIEAKGVVVAVEISIIKDKPDVLYRDKKKDAVRESL